MQMLPIFRYRASSLSITLVDRFSYSLQGTILYLQNGRNGGDNHTSGLAYQLTLTPALPLTPSRALVSRLVL